MSETTPEIIEREEIKTENLKNLRATVKRYGEIRNPPEIVSKKEVDEILKPHGLVSEDLIRPDGWLGKKLSESFGEFSDFADFLRGIREKNLGALRSRLKEKSLTWETDCEESLDGPRGLRFIETVKTYFNQMLSPQQKREIAGLFEEIEETEKVTRLLALHDLASLGEALFADDALKQAKIPLASRDYSETIQKMNEWPALHVYLVNLVLGTSGEKLQEAYDEVIVPLADEELDLIESLRHKNGDKFRNLSHVWHGIGQNRKETKKTMDSVVLEIWTHLQDWETLNPTPKQRRALYDILENKLFDELYAGGHESWPGTRAVNVIETIRDPRAIPGLIRHLRMFGSGHTSAAAAHSLKEIISNPLAEEDLNEVIKEMPVLEQQIVTNWFQDSESPVNKVFEGKFGNRGYTVASFIQDAEKHLAYDVLIGVARKIADSKGETIGEKAILDFFSGNFGEWGQAEGVETLLFRDLQEAARSIAKSGISGWKENLPRLFNALVSPEDKDYLSFPRIIATEGLDLNPELMSRLESLYGLKELKKGAFARSAFAEGMLFLTSKNEGKEIFESILSVSTGAKEDPGRIRGIFRMMRSLEGLEAFDFTPGETLNEITENLRGKLVEAVKEKMELEDEDKAILNERLDFLLESDVLEIIPTLLARFGENRVRVANVVREIGRHIVRGDFKEWRNGLETAEIQLSALTEDKCEAWINPTDEVRIEVQAQKGREAREAAVGAIKRITAEAKAHINEVYKFEFSLERLRQLELIQRELIKKLKEPSTTSEEKKELGLRKRSIDAEFKLVAGFIKLEKLEADQLNGKKILEVIAVTQRAMEVLKNLEQPIQDLTQVEKVFTTQEELATVTRLRAYDTDDPMVLLKSGTEPRETCQSWRQGSYNHCLPAYVADVNKRVINVENERNEILARSIAKLTHIMVEGERMPAVYLEPIYANTEIASVYQAVVRLALAKAKATGAVLVVKGEIEVATGADHEKTVSILPREAERLGFKVEQKDVEVFIPQSYNPNEYSDSLGGDIFMFNRYVSLPKVNVVIPV